MKCSINKQLRKEQTKQLEQCLESHNLKQHINIKKHITIDNVRDSPSVKQIKSALVRGVISNKLKNKISKFKYKRTTTKAI